jgi:ATP synthase protein I
MTEPDKGDPGRDSISFEKRLEAARKKQGMDPTPADSVGNTQASAMGVGVRVGVELVAAMVVGVGIGWYLDHWLHTSPLFLVVFVLLGGAAGVANVWRMMGPKPQSPPGKTK